MKISSVLLALVLCAGTVQAAETVPANAVQHLPTLRTVIESHWADAPYRSVFAGQVEQETCVSLKHKKCWSPYAELKTEREYGFGLGQITVTKSFDNFQEARKLDSSLKNWQWENRYNAEFQLRTLVLTDRFNFGKFVWASDPYERMAFALGAYNGGVGGVLSDRRVCSTLPNCDPSRWFGNVEHTSRKAKVAVKGYGKSFFEINREYVRNILTLRRNKYVPHTGE